MDANAIINDFANFMGAAECEVQRRKEAEKFENGQLVQVVKGHFKGTKGAVTSAMVYGGWLVVQVAEDGAIMVDPFDIEAVPLDVDGITTALTAMLKQIPVYDIASVHFDSGCIEVRIRSANTFKHTFPDAEKKMESYGAGNYAKLSKTVQGIKYTFNGYLPEKEEPEEGADK